MTDYSYYDALLRYCELCCGIYSKKKDTASETVADHSYYEKMLNYLELRYNHNHDSKGRFCSGSGAGGNSSVKTYGAELASKIIPPDKKKVIKALVNRVKSDIIDTGEHEMYPESIAGVKRGSPMRQTTEGATRIIQHISKMNMQIIVNPALLHTKRVCADIMCMLRGLMRMM